MKRMSGIFFTRKSKENQRRWNPLLQRFGRILRPDGVNKVDFKPKRKTPAQTERVCSACALRHGPNKELYPAFGKTCYKCNRKNHFAVKCKLSRKRRVQTVTTQQYDRENDSSSGSDYGQVDSVTIKEKINAVSQETIKAEMMVKGKPIVFQLDSGASVNILNQKHVMGKTLEHSNKTCVMWNGAEVKPLGECRVKMINPKIGQKYAVKFDIVKEDFDPLLGTNAIQKMALITVNNEKFKMVAKVFQVDEFISQHSDSIINEFKDVFKDELGRLPGEVHLEVDSGVTPNVAAARRIPVALKDKLKVELEKRVKKKVIEPVSVPTPWVSALALVVKKNGNLRICIDPRPLNKALKREHFQLPTLDDLLPELADSKVFSTLDLRDGFWQVKVDEASSRLTTFTTPFGRFRWKVLPFGIAPAPEIFQKALFNNVSDLEGVINKADDLLVVGKSKTMEEATVDHDIKLKKLLQRCDRGMRLNAGKLNLRQTSISFLGHMITSDGLLPEPEKIEAIKEMPCPTDVKGEQRLGGLVNYLAKFLPHISDVMAPIRNLVKANVAWTWSQIHEEAFGKIKKLVSEALVLRYYDPKKSFVIQYDVSEKGMGAALLQEGQPLAYISCALTDTETRYAQIEKELLAVVYACERFHQYTFGRQITVLTDHRPLEAIIKKNWGYAQNDWKTC